MAVKMVVEWRNRRRKDMQRERCWNKFLDQGREARAVHITECNSCLDRAWNIWKRVNY